MKDFKVVFNDGEELTVSGFSIYAQDGMYCIKTDSETESFKQSEVKCISPAEDK